MPDAGLPTEAFAEVGGFGFDNFANTSIGFNDRRVANRNAQYWGIPMNNIWARDAIVSDETSSWGIIQYKFLENAKGEAITATRSYRLSGVTTLNIVDVIAASMTDVQISGETPGSAIVMGKQAGDDVLAWVGPSDRRETDWEITMATEDTYTVGEYQESKRVSKVAFFKVWVMGSRHVIDRTFALLAKSFKEAHAAEIKWWYMGNQGAKSRTIFLDPLTTKLHPEFYPDIEDPRKLIADYLTSNQSVLLMAGPPGTGKTTLLRHMICDHSLMAHIVYDEAIMNNDAVFQDFLFDNDSDVMVIEDADTVLTAREDSQNKMMARFLSVSDGLIKLPDKKLIFTTNISDFGRVDEALIRPGRCFDVIHTRPLNLTEAQAAARIAGVPIPTEKGEYTLAELFNQGSRKPQRSARKVGFK